MKQSLSIAARPGGGVVSDLTKRAIVPKGSGHQATQMGAAILALTLCVLGRTEAVKRTR
jgi:hypothetical protein